MPDWKKFVEDRMITVEQAAATVESGDRIWLGSTLCVPYGVLDALAERYEDLRDVLLIASMYLAPFKILNDPKYKKTFHTMTLFPNALERAAAKIGAIDFHSVPYTYWERAAQEVYKVNSVITEVCEPDEDGYVNLGALGVGWTSNIVRNAPKLIAVINKYNKPVRGDAVKVKVPISRFQHFIRHDHPLPSLPTNPPEAIDEKIASYILPHIERGVTFQIGMGGLGDSIGLGLIKKKGLIIRTEIMTNCMVDLLESGAVDHVYAGGAFGDQRLYDIFDDPRVSFSDCWDQLEPESIGKTPNFVSINATLMTDIIGQCCSEAIGVTQYSAIGGQIDCVRGAAKSKGGKSFICLRSTRKDKEGKVHSNIVAKLPEGSIVTTPRYDVMYLVTEYGIADIFLRSNKERIKAIINIAHPDFREELRAQAIGQGNMFPEDFD
jgi:acyl-CoA hydrolase